MRLFRTWKRLESWLEPERARLEALRSLQVDAGNWERNAKNEGFLNHRANRLAEARHLSENTGYAKRLFHRTSHPIRAHCIHARGHDG